MRHRPPTPDKGEFVISVIGEGCSGVQAGFAQETNVTVADLELYRVYNKTLPKFT